MLSSENVVEFDNLRKRALESVSKMVRSRPRSEYHSWGGNNVKVGVILGIIFYITSNE
jgi:hypothetical protein